MRTFVGPDSNITFEEVFNPLILQLPNMDSLSICMRNGGFEIRTRTRKVINHERVEVQINVYRIMDGEVEKL